VPVRQKETGFFGRTDSIRVDLSQYFGNADDVDEGAVLGRSGDEHFMEGLTPTASNTLIPVSSQAGLRKIFNWTTSSSVLSNISLTFPEGLEEAQQCGLPRDVTIWAVYQLQEIE
jgi:hypothetical protein